MNSEFRPPLRPVISFFYVQSTPFCPPPPPAADLSPAQQQHVDALLRRLPSVAALRLELCGDPSAAWGNVPAGMMSDLRFWTVYFTLLHAHLPPTEAERLSSLSLRMLEATLHRS